MTTQDEGSKGIEDLPANIGKPATRALAGAGVHSLDQLTDKTETELLMLHGMGPKAMDRLRSALAARGQSFAGERGDGHE